MMVSATRVDTSREVRDYRLIWAGQSVSLIGSAVTTFALPVVATVILDATPAQLGLLTALTAVPVFLAPLYAGPVADRFDRRHTLVVTDAARAVLLTAVPLLWATHQLTFPVLLATAVGLALLSAQFETAIFSYLPSVVCRERLLTANSRIETSRTLAQVLGPGGTGAIVLVMSLPVALLVDAASYGVSVLTILLIRLREPRTTRSPMTRSDYLRSVADGASIIWTRMPLRLLGIGSGTFNFFVGISTAVTTYFALRTLGIASSAYGVAVAVGCLGGVLAAILAPRIVDLIGYRAAFSHGLLCGGCAEFFMITARPGGFYPLVAVAATQFIAYFAITIYIIANATVRQVLIPRAALGRVYASLRVFSQGLLPFGALAGGLLADAWSARGALTVAAIGEIGVACAFFYFRGHIPRRLDAAAA
jgi:Na+/melibiose symporter-like transporter